jgi:hypothetical protein
MMGTLHEDQFTSLNSSYNENCFRQTVGKVKTYISRSKFFFKSCCLWDNVKNIVDLDRPQLTIWHMCIACWIPKATHTHTEYVILNAFPLHHWSHERASVLRYMHAVLLDVNSSI